jgi:PDZ domain-containing secreted protein
MYRIVTLAAAAAALAMGASLANAEEATGAIENIDLTDNTFEVDGKLFTASPENTVGPDLSELKEGDEVTVSYETPGETSPPYNAMTITQSE